jgi:chloramphenicol 3-O phosphotransferase
MPSRPSASRCSQHRSRALPRLSRRSSDPYSAASSTRWRPLRALIDGGNAVILDHVLHDLAMYESYRQAAAGLDLFAVGVTCSLDVLEARERARGDRVLGRARGLADIVHGFCAYDVTVDTGALPPEACVAVILDALATRS